MGLSNATAGNVKLCCQFLKIFILKFNFWAVIPFIGTCPKELKTKVQTNPWHEYLQKISWNSLKWKWLNTPLNRWMGKLWINLKWNMQQQQHPNRNNEVLIHITTQVKLGEVIPGNKKKKWVTKIIHSMLSLIWSMHNGQVHRQEVQYWLLRDGIKEK